MRTYIPACVDVGFEYGYVSSFAVSRHEYSRGCTYQDSGKSSHNQSEAGAWVPLPHLAPSPEEPRTSIRTEASKAYGQLLLHSPLPWAAAPTTGCLGLFMPPSSVHFLRLQAWSTRHRMQGPKLALLCKTYFHRCIIVANRHSQVELTELKHLVFHLQVM